MGCYQPVADFAVIGRPVEGFHQAAVLQLALDQTVAAHGDALAGHGGFNHDVVVVQHHAGVLLEVDLIMRRPIGPLERPVRGGHQ